MYGQRATFFPRGLAGHLYWWAVAPFHGVVFGSMVRNITRRAVEFDGEGQVTAQADGETSAETPVEIAS